MARSSRVFIHGNVYDIGFRTEEGLPLVASEVMKVILRGVFARAQHLFPVQICHFVVMANHMHLLVVVEDPAHLPSFVGYIKRESAHAINRLIGRKQRTIWTESFNPPIVLDAEAVMEKIAYYYLNPVAAGLVPSIEEYPNLNSWEAFMNGSQELECKKIARNQITEIDTENYSATADLKMAEELCEGSNLEHTLVIEPNAWLRIFHETRTATVESIKEKIVKRLEARKAELIKELGIREFLGASKLRSASMKAKHEPKKNQIKCLCLSSIRELREKFIALIKEMREKYNKKIKGLLPQERLRHLPGGFFAPGGYLLSNFTPYSLQI